MPNERLHAKLTDPVSGHILITGHSGVGKSTYSKKLSEKLGLRLIQLDKDPEFVKMVENWKVSSEPPEGWEDTARGVAQRAM